MSKGEHKTQKSAWLFSYLIAFLFLILEIIFFLYITNYFS
jgi:hypothetical protein